MEPPLSKFLIDMLYEYDTLLTVRNSGISYVDASKNSRDCHEHYRMNDMYSNFTYCYIKEKEDFKNFCHSLKSIEMICVFFSDDSELSECKARIEAHPDLSYASLQKSNLEIFHSSAGKGNALLRLADSLGIDRVDTIAVGDSQNDITMLGAAGLGLAMGNSSGGLAEFADEQICDNDSHAIKYILEHYIKK